MTIEPYTEHEAEQQAPLTSPLVNYTSLERSSYLSVEFVEKIQKHARQLQTNSRPRNYFRRR